MLGKIIMVVKQEIRQLPKPADFLSEFLPAWTIEVHTAPSNASVAQLVVGREFQRFTNRVAYIIP